METLCSLNYDHPCLSTLSCLFLRITKFVIYHKILQLCQNIQKYIILQKILGTHHVLENALSEKGEGEKECILMYNCIHEIQTCLIHIFLEKEMKYKRK